MGIIPPHNVLQSGRSIWVLTPNENFQQKQLIGPMKFGERFETRISTHVMVVFYGKWRIMIF
ncbi:hypothetical protein CR513_20301, partial [Mucuna pruriens]